MAYQLYGWQLKNGEKHVLKADPGNHPGIPLENVMKADGALRPECCCPGCCCNFECIDGTVVPPPLTASITGTGDCSCWNGSYALTYGGAGGGSCNWSFQADRDCNGTTYCFTVNFGCTDERPPADDCPFTVTAGCSDPPLPGPCLVPPGVAVSTLTCDPFVATGTIELTTPSFCCDGILTITITE